MSTCDTCRFFVPQVVKKETSKPKVGDCHRFPPVVHLDQEITDDREIFSYTSFPVVAEIEWCGEHKADPRKMT